MESSQTEFAPWVGLGWISENKKKSKKIDIDYCMDIANDHLYWLPLY